MLAWKKNFNSSSFSHISNRARYGKGGWYFSSTSHVQLPCFSFCVSWCPFLFFFFFLHCGSAFFFFFLHCGCGFLHVVSSSHFFLPLHKFCCLFSLTSKRFNFSACRFVFSLVQFQGLTVIVDGHWLCNVSSVATCLGGASVLPCAYELQRQKALLTHA